MGRGNICVHGEFDRLVYIDYDNFEEEWDFEDSIDYFIESFENRFKSFYRVNKYWLSNYEKVIMENELYYVVLEHNDWSIAIKLIAKEEGYLEEGQKKNFQSKHIENYYKGLKECLFEQFDKIGVYGGPWTSGVITKEEYYNEEE